MNDLGLKRRMRAAGIHFAISVAIAALASLLVFMVWYPSPYSAIAGGLSLFVLLVSVDVALGPLLTAVAASPGKPRAELARDLFFIALVQLAAFGYGMFTIAMARPVHLVFEIDRFKVVSAADIEPESLAKAPAALRSLPWTGPTVIAALKPTDPDELMRSVELGLAGIDLAVQPARWVEYASVTDAAWRAARPVAALARRYPQAAAPLARIAADAGQPQGELRFMPLVSRQTSWVSVIAMPGARVVGYLPLDGFF